MELLFTTETSINFTENISQNLVFFPNLRPSPVD